MLDQHSLAPAAANVAQSETVALFVSDLHLHASLPQTTTAFADFLQRHALRTRQLYVLGDLFEYWAGDDDLDAPANRGVVDALRAVSDAGIEVFWIAGNRDFLVGDAFATAAGLTRLPDPFIATIAGRRIVLAHGDEQCTDDAAYMQFRSQVREPEWQRNFLAMPLAQRKTIIEGLRTGSREAQRNKSSEIMDVNAAAIADVFRTSGADVMIHGHTHRPAMHQYSDGERLLTRYVLPDWDCDCDRARGGWIAIDEDGNILSVGLDGMAVRTPTRTVS